MGFMKIFSGQFSRLLMQIVYLFALARLVSPKEYALFTSIMLFSGFFAPFANLGAGMLMIKSVSRDDGDPPVEFGVAMFSTIAFSSLCVIIFTVSGYFYFHNSSMEWYRIIIYCALIGISELIFMKISELVLQLYQATSNNSEASKILFLTGLSRIISIIPLFVWTFNHGITLPISLFFASMLCAVVSVFSVNKNFGSFKVIYRKHQLLDGLYFSIGASMQSLIANYDKTLVGRSASLSIGSESYILAYKFIDAVNTVVRSFLFSVFSRLFRKELEIAEVVKILRTTVILGALCSASLLVISLFAQDLFPEYKDLSHFLILLSLVPFFQSISAVGNDYLSGSGNQKTRSLIQLAFFIIGLVAYPISFSKYEVNSVIYTNIALNFLLAVSTLIISYLHIRKSRGFI